MPLTDIESLLLDTNVWIDYFLRAPKTSDVIDRLVQHAESSGITLSYAPTTAKDVFFILPRRLRLMDANAHPATSYVPAAWACIDYMTEHAVCATLSLGECELARMMRTRFSDFEDNLIVAAANTAKVDYIVTSDRGMLERMPEACITPQRALELVGAA